MAQPTCCSAVWAGRKSDGLLARAGDRVSRLDDYETALNRVPPGTLRNTTSPRAMAGNVVALMNRRGVMGANSRGLLKQWMHDTDTGLKRLRAGLPVDWWAGDKTGTGLPDDVPGCYVDLLWAEPKGRGALAIAAFYRPEKPTPNGDSHAEAILANVAHTIVSQGK
jgi:beta-lactamase class A